MKALSVKQPYASMIASGQKTIETRTWKTNYRGDLLICSSKKPYCGPVGVALCIVNLYGCRPMNRQDEFWAQCEFYEGAWAWLFSKEIQLIEPFPVKGQLGLFNVELSTATQSLGNMNQKSKEKREKRLLTK